MNPMKFLQQPPRFLFFTGKGGVGKTSIACATAIELATRGQRVLLVSTDPASNVGQVFGITIGNHITPMAAVPGLDALEIDPQAAAQAYRDRIVGPVRGLLPDDVVRGIEEQLSGACTTEIAAFDEFTGLLTDTALTQATSTSFSTPRPPATPSACCSCRARGAASWRKARATRPAWARWPAWKSSARSTRRPSMHWPTPQRTRLVLVARAQTSTLVEAGRTHTELAAIGLSQQYLVINGVFPAAATAADTLAAAIVEREQAALLAMPVALTRLPTDRIALKPFNLVGLDALRHLLGDSAPVEADGLPPEAALAAPSLAALVDEIALDGHGLVMLMGKGGVGKTTLAAAVAVELARRGLPVHLTTSDPAAHLAETLDGTLENLTVSRIDPQEVTAQYRAQVLATQGAKLDAAGRAVLEEDLRSPCTEEIAVFQAFSRVIREAGKKFVVMDTAPTGHTLLLLDATGAYHRDIVRQMGSTGVHFTTPMMQLQDPKQTKVLMVTLAETTPVLEAANLQADLRRAGIEPWAWIINNSVAAASVTSPLLRQRAHNELREIEAVATRHARRYAVVPLLEDEPVGVDRLEQLAMNGVTA